MTKAVFIHTGQQKTGMSEESLNGRKEGVQCVAENLAVERRISGQEDLIETKSGSGKKKQKFQDGCEVLARWTDGLLYLGSVVQVDEENQQCVVKFEDNSLYWALYKDLQKGAMDPSEIVCSVCDGGSSEAPNEIVICDQCNRGYHQLCHRPTIGSDVLQPDVPWCCRNCVFANTARKGGATKMGPSAYVMQVMKQSLPYDLKSLSWDSQHRTNLEQCYCYCGGPGEWFMKMIQCCRCQQWFHEACVQCLDMPVMHGDRFYIFVCAVCNPGGAEYLARLELKWTDIAHLVLFNLSVEHNKKYFDIDNSIIPFLNKNWDLLQLQGDLVTTKEEDRKEFLNTALLNNKSRFKSGKEIKKRTSLWGLRIRVPPPVPNVTLPPSIPVTSKLLQELKLKRRKSKIIVCYPQKKNPEKSTDSAQNLRLRSLECRQKLEESIKMDKPRKPPDSANHSYRGYTSVPSVFPKTEASDSDDGLLPFSTLDSIIPHPTDFEGLNHPFWNLECTQKSRLPSCALKRKLSEEDIRIAKNGEIRRRYHRKRRNIVTGTWVNGQTSEGSLDTGSESDNTAEKCVTVGHKVGKCAHTRRTENPICSSSVNHYVSSVVTNGENIQILAKRVNLEGKVQYLVEREEVSS